MTIPDVIQFDAVALVDTLVEISGSSREHVLKVICDMLISDNATLEISKDDGTKVTLSPEEAFAKGFLVKVPQPADDIH